MNLINFITKISTSTPRIEDFYDYIKGYFYGWTSTKYLPKTEDYRIISIAENIWVLQIDYNKSKLISDIYIKDKNIIDVNPAAFSTSLSTIILNYNNISSSNIDSMLKYWANTKYGVAGYIQNVQLNIEYNTNLRTQASSINYNILTKSRKWQITESAIPAITPTSTPTPSITPSLRNSYVYTIAGGSSVGDTDGVSCAVTPTPSINAPKPLTVLTVAGTGGEGDKDGVSCLYVAPSPTPTQSITPSQTPNITPSNSLTPTPTLTPTTTTTTTPTVTPSSTPICVKVDIKQEDVCCKEPATVENHGSTTFNSKVTSYTKLLNRIKTSLGFPLIQLEVTDEQIYTAIDVSLEFFTKFTGYTEEYLIFKSTLYKKGIGLPIGDLFSITPEMANSITPQCSNLSSAGMWYDIDLESRRKVMNVFTVQPGDNSGINTLFTIEQTIAQQAYFGHLLGNIGFDLVTFDVLKMWLKTREKVLALKPSFRFYPEQQILRLTPEPETRSTPYFGIVGAFVQKPVRDLISQLWVYKYAMAQIKVTIGHVRGKFSGTGLYGGQSLNHSDMMSQGLKEIDELEKELKSDLIDREPIPFFIG